MSDESSRKRRKVAEELPTSKDTSNSPPTKGFTPLTRSLLNVEPILIGSELEEHQASATLTALNKTQEIPHNSHTSMATGPKAQSGKVYYEGPDDVLYDCYEACMNAFDEVLAEEAGECELDGCAGVDPFFADIDRFSYVFDDE